MDSMLRYGTLVILVLQTTATVLLLRYSRTRPGQPYLASTAVMLNECCKFTVCVFSLYAQRGKKRPDLLILASDSCQTVARSALFGLYGRNAQ